MIVKSHYIFDEVTRKITFDKTAALYLFEKKVLADYAVDIDSIETVDEYDRIRHEYHSAFNRAVSEQWHNVTPITIKEKYDKAMMTGNIHEVKRLRMIIERMKQYGLRVVK